MRGISGLFRGFFETMHTSGRLSRVVFLLGLIHRLATPTHLSEIVPHVDVQQTLEHKDADALQGVQDGECVGKVDVVEGKVEEAENPGGPQEEDEQDDPFDIREQQLDVHFACVELVEDHGVEGVDEEAGMMKVRMK